MSAVTKLVIKIRTVKYISSHFGSKTSNSHYPIKVIGLCLSVCLCVYQWISLTAKLVLPYNVAIDRSWKI